MEENGEQTFWEHLDELRSALIRIICAGLLCGIVAFIFKEWLFDFILAPSKSDFVTYRLFNSLSGLTGVEVEDFSVTMINTALAQQFIIHMKTAFIVGLLCASPYILYCIMHFISPALYNAEKRLVFGVVGSGYVMFMVGMALCYMLIFPLTFRFLGTYQVNELGFSMTFVATLSMVYSAVRIAASFFLGAYADKKGFAKMMQICFGLLGAAFFVNIFTAPANGKRLMRSPTNTTEKIRISSNFRNSYCKNCYLNSERSRVTPSKEKSSTGQSR